MKLISPDGIERHYVMQYVGIYRLEQEMLPNGKAIFYEYNQQELIKISSEDPNRGDKLGGDPGKKSLYFLNSEGLRHCLKRFQSKNFL